MKLLLLNTHTQSQISIDLDGMNVESISLINSPFKARQSTDANDKPQISTQSIETIEICGQTIDQNILLAQQFYLLNLCDYNINVCGQWFDHRFL